MKNELVFATVVQIDLISMSAIKLDMISVYG